MSPKKVSTGIEKKLYKSRKDKMIDGICAGVADYFGLDVTLVRVLWVVAGLIHGFGLVAYVAAMVIMPRNPEHDSLTESDKVKHHPGYLWGVGLILLGVLILTDEWDHLYPWHYHRHWGFWDGFGFDAHLLLPVLLLTAGVVYLIHALKKKESQPTDGPQAPLSERIPFRRHKTDRWIAGVLSGLAEYIHLDVVLVRIVFAALALSTHLFFFVLLYVGLWVSVPESPDR